jgi:hypothetical protein
MTTQPKPLEALARYFAITEREGQYEIRCKTCRKAWVLPFQKAENFNPLGLFDHVFAHEKSTGAEQ